jgi:hypothetical protein
MSSIDKWSCERWNDSICTRKSSRIVKIPQEDVLLFDRTHEAIRPIPIENVSVFQWHYRRLDEPMLGGIHSGVDIGCVIYHDEAQSWFARFVTMMKSCVSVNWLFGDESVHFHEGQNGNVKVDARHLLAQSNSARGGESTSWGAGSLSLAILFQAQCLSPSTHSQNPFRINPPERLESGYTALDFHSVIPFLGSCIRFIASRYRQWLNALDRSTGNAIECGYWLCDISCRSRAFFSLCRAKRDCSSPCDSRSTMPILAKRYLIFE